VSDRPLRFGVVIQTPRDPQSAVYIGYQSLAAVLESQGHSVAIVSPSDFRPLKRFGGRLVPLAYPFAIASWVHARRNDFDLVMFHSYSGWLASALGRRPRALVMFHGVEPLYHRELRKEAETSGHTLSRRYRFLQETVMPAFLKIACRTAAGVACLNRAEAYYLVSRKWVAERDVYVLAHGVPPEFFVAARPTRPIQTLLFVGQWLPMKGTRYLRDAAATLLTDDPAMLLVCAGTLLAEGPIRAEFPEALRDRVIVLPRVDQATLAGLYRDADAFIFPSLYEGFSRAIVEAMASRLPIVCTSVGVASDALQNDGNALIVPKRDAESIVAAVRRLQSDSALARRLADAAAETAVEYSLEAVMQRTTSVITDVARANHHD
jgi:glycosyltransferase involved in cell wall biosynthesis